MSNESIIVIGAGPAGLAAAHELIGQGFTPLVLEKAVQEISRLGLVQAHKVEGGVVFRQRKAYPVYHLGYRQALETIQKFLSTLANLQTIGRNGMYRYNNQDHSMLTGILAARNLRGVVHNLWDVNTLERHHEEATAPAKA